MNTNDPKAVLKSVWSENGTEGKAAVVTVAAGIAAIVILAALVVYLI